MSFQLPTATALPSEIQLGKEKPQGAFCLRTRYALSANSANSWVPSTLVSLPLQTGTPGTFTDVKQGTINCTLQISNTNPYVDYLNFGPSGAIIFFDEMRIYSSGTPIEENLRYSESVDLLMMQGGWQSKPFHVYRRNKWRAANGRAGHKHVNFIKPSMVDSTGAPMFGRTPFMDKNSSVYAPPAVSFGYVTSSETFGNAVPDWGYHAVGIANSAIGTPENATAIMGSVVGTDGLPFNDAGYGDISTFTTYVQYLYDGNSAAAKYGGGIGHNTYGCNPTHVSAYTAGSLLAKNDLLPFKNTQVARAAPTSALLTAYPWLSAAQYVPTQWPDYQPCTLSGEISDREVDVYMGGKTKVSEYMKYLSNVRSLPIGVTGNVSALGYHRGSSVLTPAVPFVNSSSCNFTEYRVSMPFLSGIYGILAEKMFPDLLIGANNLRIEFKLASAQKALWLTMDPCRRVPGTVRDFVPFSGSGQGGPRIADPVATSNGLARFCRLQNGSRAAIGCMNAAVNPYADPSGIVDDAVAGSQSILDCSQMYTTASALGEDLAPVQPQVNVDTNDTPWAITGAYQSARPGFSLSPYSNLPKPQYIPHAAPWTNKEWYLSDGVTSTTTQYINENASCYGTYLPASCPQVRRCQKSSRLSVSDNFNNAGATTFAIKDLQYIGEQVQLDDISTSAIVQQAASAEIVVWTRGYRAFEANCDVNEQQNIILPIQIGQATAMYLVFRSSSITTSHDYYSNSFVCPFVGLGFNNQLVNGYSGVGGVVPDVGGQYTLLSSLDSSSMGSFSYQLFSGTKQYPLQPIQTVPELIAEREKSTHSLNNWAWSSTENMSIIGWQQHISSATTGIQFDPFLDLGYFTTFVPTAALDDQTITQNPYFSIAEASIQQDQTTVNKFNLTVGSRIRGRRAPASVASSTTFQGVLNKFTSPIGSFFLGWDFESWTNHDDVMRTGKFLGQEQLSVRMTGCKLMSPSILNLPTVDSQQAVTQVIGCTAIVPHVVKLSFIPGGHVLSYY